VLSDYSHRTVELPLGPLPEAAVRQLAEVLVPEGALEEATKEGVIRRAEGNPLYLEELLKSVMESGRSDRDMSWAVSTGQLLPASLESLFVARIDQLPPEARRLIQTAAVVGREFPVSVLSRLSGGGDVQADLRVLMRADLVRELRRFPELLCTFRHGLIQEAALSTLTAERIRELSGRVADAYEELFADAIEEHLEELAYHSYRSTDQPRALRYLEKAAGRALDQGARDRATELLRRARKVAERLGDEEAGRRFDQRLSDLG
jgi:predicted ATPase